MKIRSIGITAVAVSILATAGFGFKKLVEDVNNVNNSLSTIEFSRQHWVTSRYVGVDAIKEILDETNTAKLDDLLGTKLTKAIHGQKISNNRYELFFLLEKAMEQTEYGMKLGTESVRDLKRLEDFIRLYEQVESTSGFESGNVAVALTEPDELSSDSATTSSFGPIMDTLNSSGSLVPWK